MSCGPCPMPPWNCLASCCWGGTDKKPSEVCLCPNRRIREAERAVVEAAEAFLAAISTNLRHPALNHLGRVGETETTLRTALAALKETRGDA